jgi:hypothetical protein
VCISSFDVDFLEFQYDSENLIVAKIIVLPQIGRTEMFFKVFLGAVALIGFFVMAES